MIQTKVFYGYAEGNTALTVYTTVQDKANEWLEGHPQAVYIDASTTVSTGYIARADELGFVPDIPNTQYTEFSLTIFVKAAAIKDMQ